MHLVQWCLPAVGKSADLYRQRLCLVLCTSPIMHQGADIQNAIFKDIQACWALHTLCHVRASLTPTVKASAVCAESLTFLDLLPLQLATAATVAALEQSAVPHEQQALPSLQQHIHQLQPFLWPCNLRLYAESEKLPCLQV